MAPNDESESDRLDMMHEMMMVLLDRKLHLAPISQSIQRALDLGTGTGIVFGPSLLHDATMLIFSSIVGHAIR